MGGSVSRGSRAHAGGYGPPSEERLVRSADRITTAELMDPDLYVTRGYPHEAWRALRREAPVRWFAFEGTRPGFWAVTKRADIVALSRAAHGGLRGQSAVE
jgi:hypothetical protein